MPARKAAKPAARKSPTRKPARKKAATKPAAAEPARPDLHALGAQVVSVFGSRRAYVLIVMPAEEAQALFPEHLSASGRTSQIEAAEREVEAIRNADKDLADGALAASAISMAFEIANPYNSATAKSYCAREMRDTLDRLRELAPPEARKDGIDDLADKRAKRRARVAKGRTGAKTQNRS